MDMMHLERRRYPRSDEAICAWLSFKRDNAAYGTTTLDVGMEGARFSTLKSVREGDHLLVCLQLPWMSIQCKGKVCWTGGESGGLSCFGVRFLDLRDYERDFLMRHIKQNEQAAV